MNVDKSVVVGLVTYGLALFLLAALVVQGIQSGSNTAEVLRRVERIEIANGRQTAENGRQVLEHREANQGDHDRLQHKIDCVLRFAVVLADPARSRDVPPTVTAGCEDTVAAVEPAK